jgi:hypothetical protein
VRDFVFILHFADDKDEILKELATSVLGHLGYVSPHVDAIVDRIRAACAACPARVPCDVRFQAQAGQLEVLVSYSGHTWQTTCPAS